LIKNIIDIIVEYFPLLIKGLGVTALLSLITVFFGAIIGTIISLMSLSKNKVLKLIGTTYVEVIRGVPLLLQLLIIYIVLPASINKFVAASIALLINSGAYVAEIIRAGIQAVDKGQMDAARSLGLSKKQAMLKVIFPQAIKNILPALGNEFITLIKETSVASIIAVVDLLQAAQFVGSRTWDLLPPLIIAAVFYLIIVLGLSKLLSIFGRRMNQSDHN